MRETAYPCVHVFSESQVLCKMSAVRLVTLTLDLWTVLLSPISLSYFHISSIFISSSFIHLIIGRAHFSYFLEHSLFHDNWLLLNSQSLAALSHKSSSTSQVLLLDSSRFRHPFSCHLLVIPPPHSPPSHSTLFRPSFLSLSLILSFSLQYTLDKTLHLFSFICIGCC